MPSLKYGLIPLLLLNLISLPSLAQSPADQKKQEEKLRIQNLIDSRIYVFQASSAMPMKGRTIQLTSMYTLKVNKDSLDVDLPYYGRAYSVDYGSTDLALRFSTNQFSYQADTAKKGGWSITIIPKDQSKASKIYMSVSTSGYCNMQVTSNSRQPISFYGIIRDRDVR